MDQYDIVIVGAGVVGLTMALALSREANLKIALLDKQVLEPRWQKENMHARVSAISMISKNIFTALNVWDEIKQQRASEFKTIRIWDMENNLCEFVLSQGFIVENNLMHDVLLAKIKQNNNISILPAMIFSI